MCASRKAGATFDDPDPEPELAGLFANMRRYSRGRDDQFWLEAWTGGRYVVERMNRVAVVVEHLLIALLGGFQPDALARSFAGDQNGMYSRFLFAWPAEPTYRRLIDTVAEVQPDIINALTRLVDLPAEENGTLLQSYVPLSRPALEAFEEFRRSSFEARAYADGREREYLAKGPAHVLRLSGTLAFLAWAFAGGPEPEKIEANFIKSAVRLWHEYCWPHARAAVRLIGISDGHANIRRVLRWVRAAGLRQVSLKDVRRDALSQTLSAGQTQALIDRLVKLRWLREVSIERATGPGWPARRWAVNPRLFIDAENACNAENREAH